jgi:hypothetical protein
LALRASAPDSSRPAAARGAGVRLLPRAAGRTGPAPNQRAVSITVERAGRRPRAVHPHRPGSMASKFSVLGSCASRVDSPVPPARQIPGAAVTAPHGVVHVPRQHDVRPRPAQRLSSLAGVAHRPLCWSREDARADGALPPHGLEGFS